MVNSVSNVMAHSVRQILFQSHREIERKCKVTPGRLNCEFTAVDGSSLFIELFVHVMHNIFSWIRSQAVEWFIPFS